MELELLASGRDADVYAVDDYRVLRRYRDGYDVAHEARYMRYLRSQDYPVPDVYRADGPDIEMARLTGPTMLQALVSQELDVDEAAELLADLLWRLHDLPAFATGDPARRVVHLDLHPGNVIMAPDGPVVIDWRNVAEGSPAVDTAMTALILAQVGVSDDPLAEPALAGMYAFRERVGRGFLAGLPEAAERRASNPTLSATEVGYIERAVAVLSAPRRPQ